MKINKILWNSVITLSAVTVMSVLMGNLNCAGFAHANDNTNTLQADEIEEVKEENNRLISQEGEIIEGDADIKEYINSLKDEVLKARYKSLLKENKDKKGVFVFLDGKKQLNFEAPGERESIHIFRSKLVGGKEVSRAYMKKDDNKYHPLYVSSRNRAEKAISAEKMEGQGITAVPDLAKMRQRMISKDSAQDAPTVLGRMHEGGLIRKLPSETATTSLPISPTPALAVTETGLDSRNTTSRTESEQSRNRGWYGTRILAEQSGDNSPTTPALAVARNSKTSATPTTESSNTDSASKDTQIMPGWADFHKRSNRPVKDGDTKLRK